MSWKIRTHAMIILVWIMIHCVLFIYFHSITPRILQVERIACIYHWQHVMHTIDRSKLFPDSNGKLSSEWLLNWINRKQVKHCFWSENCIFTSGSVFSYFISKKIVVKEMVQDFWTLSRFVWTYLKLPQKFKICRETEPVGSTAWSLRCNICPIVNSCLKIFQSICDVLDHYAYTMTLVHRLCIVCYLFPWNHVDLCWLLVCVSCKWKFPSFSTYSYQYFLTYVLI